jgi:diguanylate cyclase (GGDEF)-like protein
MTVRDKVESPDVEERYLRIVVEQSTIGTLVMESSGRPLFSNASWRKFWGSGQRGDTEAPNVFEDDRIRVAGLLPYIEKCMHEEVAVTTPALLHDPALTGGEGEPRWLKGFINPVRDRTGRLRAVILEMEDITEHKALETQLASRAFHDPLTGLPNRLLLMDRLEHALARGKRQENTKVAVLFMDLDNFKRVNDSLGHRAGDQMLLEVARRVGACLRPDDTLARLGGDEFVVLLEDVENASNAIMVVERIVRALRTPVRLNGHELYVKLSIGIALSRASEVRPEYLLHSADAAMYRAKREAKSWYKIFDWREDAPSLAHLELEDDLRRALEREEFVLHYQPRVLLETDKVVALEALIRWEHPERGLLNPAEFIPLAEETKLIIPIGRWVMKEACRQLRSFQEHFPYVKPLTVCVNVSARQFRNPGLVEEVAQILAETGVDPRFFTLEITENVSMMNAPVTLQIFQNLKDLGVKLEIDDFGTGYSSLSYLSRFPVDAIKIDRSLVEGVERDRRKAAIISATIRLARELDMAVVAEGVETDEEVASLRSLESTYGQGSYWWPPVPVEEVVGILASNASP